METSSAQGPEIVGDTHQAYAMPPVATKVHSGRKLSRINAKERIENYGKYKTINSVFIRSRMHGKRGRLPPKNMIMYELKRANLQRTRYKLKDFHLHFSTTN